jgi:proline dehydrogenase
MLRSLLLVLSEWNAPKKFLTTHSLGRRLARRFIAGEKLEDALRAVRFLNSRGFDVTLDHLGESIEDAEAAEQACRDYLQILDCLAAEGVRSHVSVKLSQLGLDVDEALARRLLQKVCLRAATHHNFVRIDMEGSAYTEATLRVFRELNAPRDALGVVIQAYLYRSEKDVEELLKCGARIRLVKGAYREPPELAFAKKSDVDKNFAKLMEKLLSSGGYHAIATHDPRLVAATKNFARARGLRPDQFEFQFLYGIQRRLQRALLRQGYRVRVYVPYGRQWYPYFMRRLAERPANVFFLLRQLFLR